MDEAWIQWQDGKREMLFLPGRLGTCRPTKRIKVAEGEDVYTALGQMIEFGRQEGFRLIRYWDGSFKKEVIL